jgi:hypothetical protein
MSDTAGARAAVRPGGSKPSKHSLHARMSKGLTCSLGCNAHLAEVKPAPTFRKSGWRELPCFLERRFWITYQRCPLRVHMDIADEAEEWHARRINHLRQPDTQGATFITTVAAAPS